MILYIIIILLIEKNIDIHIKKDLKFTLPFSISDSSCPATGRYNKLTQIFTPNLISHIEYEKHSNIMPKLIKEKYKK